MSIEGPDREIPKEIWALERIGRISLSPKDYGALRKTIEKACLRITCVTTVIKRIDDKYAMILEDIDNE